MNDNDIIAAALQAGFMISAQHGQAENKRMPVSDTETLLAFARAVLNRSAFIN